MTPIELTWGDTPLCETYGLRVASFSNDPPEVKTSVVSIPGGVDLDLTDSLTGHAAYENRTVEVTFFYDGRSSGSKPWDEVVTDLTSLLHGMRSEFKLSWDPGYTYTGRASVTSVEFVPRVSCLFTVSIDAEPWKVRQIRTTTVSAVGGIDVTCVSGSRPVHPLISCDWPVTVNWQGRQFVVPAGQTYRMADVTFGLGENHIWLSIYSWTTATWADVASKTWADLAGIEWAKVVVGESGGGGDFSGNGSVTLQWEEAYI